MDETVPDIEFDNEDVCNYCEQFDALDRDFPYDKNGELILDKLVTDVKHAGKHRKYDVIVGVSGGTDSTYLIHLAKQLGLRPIAVHLDNGWNSEIAVSNIKNCLEKLNVDLITYVIDYEEIKDILLSFMKASLPWIDVPTDIAIMSTLYRTASKLNVKYLFVGNNFRTEGKQPDEWTHSDGRQIKYIQKNYGSVKIKTYPNLTAFHLIYYAIFKKIKMVRPFYFIDYNKSKIKKIIAKEYDWQDYGGHHHESLFTRFAISYWLPKKFNIDKRKVTLSAQIRSGEITRENALQQLKILPFNSEKIDEDLEYVCKKLDITEKQFEEYFNNPNKSFLDYPSYFPIYLKMKKLAVFLFKYILPFKPMMAYELRRRNKYKTDLVK